MIGCISEYESRYRKYSIHQIDTSSDQLCFDSDPSTEANLKDFFGGG